VTVDPRPEDVAPIDHVAYDLPDGDKLSILQELLDHRGDGQIIVFGRTKHGVKKLARVLERDGYPVAALQGNLSQNARDRVMEDFRSGQVQILLATNVAARGLDITSVDLVINVDLPESPELLTHRVGRTGRMGRKGQAITLLGPDDGAKWRQLERGLNRRIPRATWPGAKAAIDANAGTVAVAPARPMHAAPARQSAPVPAAAARRTPPVPVRDALRDYTPSAAKVQEYFSRSLAETVGANGKRNGTTSTSRRVSGTPRASGPVVSNRSRHEITCSGCGQQAEVPFEPDLTRPVYCSNCFSSRRSNRRGNARS
jgi:CxxC-x17-CxxC domain-containing protein